MSINFISDEGRTSRSAISVPRVAREDVEVKKHLDVSSVDGMARRARSCWSNNGSVLLARFTEGL